MDREKYVDESWKESAALEKEKLEQMLAQNQAKSPAAQPSEKPSTAPTASSPAASSPSSAEEEEEEGEEEETGEQGATNPNFLNHLSSLAYQAMIFMGEIPNPVTGLVEKNLEQAKFLIDTLVVLRQKTKGNLSKQESDVLNSAIYELQMRFVEISQKEGIA